MPFGEITLIPGVNVERTPTLLAAAVSQSQYIRYKDSLVQKLGGWQKFYGFAVAGTPRELHAWQDLDAIDHLFVGTTTQASVITNGNLINITPQTLTSDFAPNFSTTMGSPTVTIDDPNISNVTTFDSIFFNTPIAVDGLVLSGLYQIQEITGATTYQITATANAVSGVSDEGVVPEFTTTTDAATVKVTLPVHGQSVGDTVIFPIATTGNGVTILGAYNVSAVVDDDNFDITVSNQATATSSFFMNGGNCELVYYINLGPPALGAGYGLGQYGAGGFGTGSVAAQQTGTPISATDYTSDNWGEIVLLCPFGGGVYQYDPTGGFSNAGLIATAPVFNGGIFVSTSEEILVCWGSSITEGIGVEQDPLTVSWSDVGNYTVFTPLTTNQAGSFRIPIGSKIMGGMAVASQNIIWTDIDCWAMNYQGPPFVFGFNKIGAGAGLISSHAAQQLRGNVYWMGPSNFYSLTSNGVAVMPCPVWDFVFQNMNTAFASNIRSMPNTPFNEAGWLFPSASSAGENDSYVKFNITEPNAPWDYGSIARSSWIDQTVLGTPIGATPTGIIYQHETSSDADGQPLMASFTTGYFYLAEGEDYVFVDQIIPDFKYGTYSGSQSASIQLTVNVINFPGDTPTQYGPYMFMSTTEYVSTRFRGRQASFTISSSDVGSFWRLGKVRYRYRLMGRR